MAIYITRNEKYLLSHINGKYDINQKDDYDYIISVVAREVYEEQGCDYPRTVLLLDDIKTQIEKRLKAARSSLKIYELTAYRDWVLALINRVIQSEQARASQVQSDEQALKASIVQLFAGWKVKRPPSSATV